MPQLPQPPPTGCRWGEGVPGAMNRRLGMGFNLGRPWGTNLEGKPGPRAVPWRPLRLLSRCSLGDRPAPACSHQSKPSAGQRSQWVRWVDVGGLTLGLTHAPGAMWPKPAGMSPGFPQTLQKHPGAHSWHSKSDRLLRRGNHTPGWEGGCFAPPRQQSHCHLGEGGSFCRVRGPSTSHSCHLPGPVCCRLGV